VSQRPARIRDDVARDVCADLNREHQIERDEIEGIDVGAQISAAGLGVSARVPLHLSSNRMREVSRELCQVMPLSA
jgi:hypothetical protein